MEMIIHPGPERKTPVPADKLAEEMYYLVTGIFKKHEATGDGLLDASETELLNGLATQICNLPETELGQFISARKCKLNEKQLRKSYRILMTDYDIIYYIGLIFIKSN
jgi:hypothetical protein